MKTTKQNVVLFLGTSLMLMLSCFNHLLLRDILDTLVIMEVGVESIPTLKLLLIPVTFFIAIFLMILSRGGNIERALKSYFSMNTLLLGLFACLLYFDSPLAKDFKVIGSFYLWAKISTTISIVLVWGFANQEYSFKTAAIQYPILGLLSVGTLLFGFTFFLLPISSLGENLLLVFIGIAAVLSLLTLIVYLLMSRRNLGAKESGFGLKWSYWFALAAIVFSIKFGVALSNVVFKKEMKTILSNPIPYDSNMDMSFMLLGVWGGCIVLLTIAFGVFLYFRGAKALSKILALIIFGIALGGSIFYYFPQMTTLTKDTFITNIMGYQLFISLVSVFMIFKELLFFGIKLHNRFAAKITVDLIVVSVVSPLVSFLSASTKFYTHPSGENMGYFLLFMGAIILCIASLFWIHRNLKGCQNRPLGETAICHK